MDFLSDILSNPEIVFSIKLSFKVAFLATLFNLVFTTLLAYLFAYKNFPFKLVLESLINLPLVFPPTVTGFFLLLIFGKNSFIGSILEKLNFSIIFTVKGAILASFLASFPIYFKTVKSAFEQVDKRYLLLCDLFGKSFFDKFFKVLLPLTKYSIFGAVLLSFARAIGEFGATLVVAGNIPFKTTTISLEIYNLISQGDFNLALKLSYLVAIFCFLIAYTLNKFLYRKN
ncbi:MAG TPA: molybdate ABC transporter permease subunit [Aquificae bacterium]|nr:molybdate ABC transporter permease subunit [Aquificota bacterium]